MLDVINGWRTEIAAELAGLDIQLAAAREAADVARRVLAEARRDWRALDALMRAAMPAGGFSPLITGRAEPVRQRVEAAIGANRAAELKVDALEQGLARARQALAELDAVMRHPGAPVLSVLQPGADDAEAAATPGESAIQAWRRLHADAA